MNHIELEPLTITASQQMYRNILEEMTYSKDMPSDLIQSDL